MCWSAGTEWWLAAASALPRSLYCRVRELVAHRALPGREARRGKLPLCTRAPAHPPTCRPGAFPGARGKRLCSQRCTVASGADKIAIVASGGVPDGPFLHCLGDVDGHLMPLSPAVRVRYDTLYRWLYQLQFLFHFYPCLRCHLSVTPSAYKRRPMCNVEGGSEGRKILTLGLVSS